MGLIAAGRLSAGSAVAVYTLTPYAAAAVGGVLLPRDLARAVAPRWAEVTAVLRHARWVAVATTVGAFYERLDLFLMVRFRGEAEAGLYAGALLLASVPDFVDGFLQTVLAPRVAPAAAAGRFNAVNRQYLRWAVPASAAAAAVAVTAGGWGVRTLVSARYAAAVPAFRLLVCGTLFTLAVTPLSAALLTYVRPRASAGLTAVGLAVVAGGGAVLIPRYGAVGAAAAIVAARVVVGGATGVLAGRAAGSRSAGPAV